LNRFLHITNSQRKKPLRENDIDMLLSVGKGIAMGNASEKVKEIATDICESVTDDGIYYYLKSQKIINE